MIAGRAQYDAALAQKWGAGALLVLLTAAAYLPALHGGFIWDDDTFLWNNPLIKSADGWWRFWFTSEAPDYFPLTSTTLWLEWRLWSGHPAGYHAVNILLHALSAVLWWRILERLKIPLAWLAAAVFALHPVNVESVAWITERKNTLAMFFYAWALLGYLKFEDAKRQGWYWISVAAFALALLSKTAVVMLPVALLGLAWWRRGRVDRRDCLRTLPFFALAVVLGGVTVWFQYQRAIGGDVVRAAGVAGRLAGAAWALWFYLYKALLPLNLVFVYPRWQVDPAKALSWLPAVLMAGVLWASWRFRHSWGRGLLFGLGYFVLLLLPVLGFLDIYFMRYSLVADHWQYFAILGPIVLALAGISRLLAPLAPGNRRAFIQPSLAAALLVVLGVLTWQQTRRYHDSETLWRATLIGNPACSLALNNLGATCVEQGHPDQGLEYLQRSLQVDPANVETYVNLGSAFVQSKRYQEALTNYLTALELRPDSVEALIGLSETLMQLGRAAEALTQLQRAASLHPDRADAQTALGEALAKQGKATQAIEHYQESLRLAPHSAKTHNDLGLALVSQNRWEDARAELETALREDPGFLEVHTHLGGVLVQAGRLDEAIVQFTLFLKSKPEDAGAQESLGIALAMNGALDMAFTHLREAMRLAPDNPDIRFNLANVLAAQRKFDEAIQQYNEVLRIAPDHVQARSNLGCALADLGRRDDAVRELQEVLRLQPDFAPARARLRELVSQPSK